MKILQKIYDRLSNFEKIPESALEKFCGNSIHLFIACFIVTLVLLLWHLLFLNVNFCKGSLRVHSCQSFLIQYYDVSLQHTGGECVLLPSYLILKEIRKKARLLCEQSQKKECCRYSEQTTFRCMNVSEVAINFSSGIKGS